MGWAIMNDSPDLDALSFKGRRGLARIFDATGYSLAGLRAAYRGEAAFRQLLFRHLAFRRRLLRCCGACRKCLLV